MSFVFLLACVTEQQQQERDTRNNNDHLFCCYIRSHESAIKKENSIELIMPAQLEQCLGVRVSER